MITDFCIANKSGSRAIWLDFADDEIVGVHDINDTIVVNCDACKPIEPRDSASSIHIAFRVIISKFTGKGGDLASSGDFSDGIFIT